MKKFRKPLILLISLTMLLSNMSFAFAVDSDVTENGQETSIEAEQNDSVEAAETENGDAEVNSEEGTGSGQNSANTSKQVRAKANANSNSATTNIADYLSDDSYVQFKYGSPLNTVTYSRSMNNINLSGDTTIQDKNSVDLDLATLKSMTAKLNISFDDDEVITSDQVFTYTLPSVPGLKWPGLSKTNLLSEDMSVLGSYWVTDGIVYVQFNEDFIGLNNRFAGISLDATFDYTQYANDTQVRFEFEGIGDFVGSLVVPKYLDIVKKDSMVKVDENSDIAAIFANNTRTTSSSANGSNYPLITLDDDGQYITQILKVTATGNQSDVEIKDYYYAPYSTTIGGSNRYLYNNDWYYDSTIALVKVSKDGTVTELNENVDYILQNHSSASTKYVSWKLEDGLNDGDAIYVAYKTKYTGNIRTSSSSSNSNGADSDSTNNSSHASQPSSCEYDVATVTSNESSEKVASLSNNLYYYGVSKTCTNLDTVNKEATWVIYYNIGENYTKLDGINIKDLAGTGTTLNIIEGSTNVKLVKSSDLSDEPFESARYISRADFSKYGTNVVSNGVSTTEGWGAFESKFMTSSGFKIPEGTGYGALRVEFKTKYVGSDNAKGDQSSLNNYAYWGGSYHSLTVNIGSTGNSYPKIFNKTGTFASNSEGKADWHTGLIKWTSTFALDPGMQLEYRDGIGIYQRLALDNEDYPMTITYSDGSNNAVKSEITEYKEGESTDPDSVYYILTVYKNVDTTYVRSQGTRTDPDFAIKFVDYNGDEVILGAGNYTITYYTYFSPVRTSSDSRYSTYDYGYHYFGHNESNSAWIVYNQGKHYMSASASVYFTTYIKKGSDNTYLKYTGDKVTIPDELKPKQLNELFWSFSIPEMTETTSKIVLTDTFSIGSITDSSGSSHTYSDKQTLETDRFVVYNGTTKLTSDQYDLVETTDGFTLTLTKEKGYDPTKVVTAYYMTSIPIDEMEQGETHYYGNNVRVTTAYDEALGELTGTETAFRNNAYYYNGDGQKFTYEIVAKGDDYDADNQYITYTLDVNKYELALNKGEPVELTDEMDDCLEYDVDDDGNFIVPIQVLDEDGNALSSDEYTVELTKTTNTDGTVSYGPLKITIPDQKHLTIKYRVRVKSGTRPSDPTATTMEANNSVKFSTGDYSGIGTSDKVTLTGLSAAVGGTPVYLTVQKSDATNENLLLDGAKYNVTIYKRSTDSEGNWTLTESETLEGVTKNGIYTIKTSNQRVLKVQEVTAPTGYTIDDEDPHYYIIERSTEGTKDELKEKYSSTFLADVDWDKNVELFNTERPKVEFTDTPKEVTSSVNDEFTLTKKDAEDTETTLEGAVFTICSDEKATEPVQINGEDVTATTDEDGRIVFSTENDGILNKLVPKAGESVTYYLKETSAPAGYKLSSDIRSFTISASKQSAWSEDHTVLKNVITYTIETDESTEEETSKSITVTDDRDRDTKVNDASLTLTKLDAEGTEDNPITLEGAEFALYDGDGNVIRTYTTGSDGTFEIATDDEDLASYIPKHDTDADESSVQFTLKETKAPSGYALSEKEYTVTVSLVSSTDWSGEESSRKYLTTRQYSIDISGAENNQISDDRIRASKRIDNDLTLTKIDAEDSAKLSDAEFTLYADENLSESIKTFTTDEYGNFVLATDDESLANIIPSFANDVDEASEAVTLYLKETNAPAGYKRSETVHTVKIKANRETNWEGEGEERKYVTTTTYSIVVDEGEDTESSTALEVTNDRVRVSEVEHDELILTKTDAEDSQTLSDAEFTLYADEDLTEAIKTFETDENGSFKILTDDEDLADNVPAFADSDDEGTESVIMYLKETDAPDGYKLSDTVHAVKVTAERKTIWEGEGSERKYVTTTVYTIVAADSSKAISATDNRVRNTEIKHDEVTITKLDAEGTEDNPIALADAEFTLYDKDGKEIKTFTTDADGTFTIATDDEDLDSYIPKQDEDEASDSEVLYLKETKAPSGYVLSNKEYKVTISLVSNTDWTGEGSEREYLTTRTYSIKVSDVEDNEISNDRKRSSKRTDNEITLTKIDAEDSAVLSGAEFTLYADEDLTEAIRTYETDEDGNFVVTTGDAKLADSIPAFADDVDEASDSVTLYLKETKAPTGYNLSDTVHTVEVSANRTTEWEGEGDDRQYVTTTVYTITLAEDDTLQVTNERNRTSTITPDSMEIIKVDTSNHELSGATFALYADEDCSELITTFTAGHAVLSTDDVDLQSFIPVIADGVDDGTDEATFYLKETKAPSGYIADETVYEIQVKVERSTSWTESHEEYLTETIYTISSDGEKVINVVNEKEEDPSNVKTGDYNNMILWTMLALMASLGVVIMAIRRRRVAK